MRWNKLAVFDEAPARKSCSRCGVTRAARQHSPTVSLAGVAADTLADADRKALDAETLADLAEQVSESADHAAAVARDVASRARRVAVESRKAEGTAAKALTRAETNVGDVRGSEAVARDRYAEGTRDAASRSDPAQGRGSRSAP